MSKEWDETVKGKVDEGVGARQKVIQENGTRGQGEEKAKEQERKQG